MERVRITDVALRDGLQNEPLGPDGRPVPTDQRVRLARLLADAGVDEIEAGAFVSPRAVPQLADSASLFAALAGIPALPTLSALVPNEQGMQAALEVNRRHGRVISKVAVFTAASETFARRNINCTIAQSLARFEPVVRLARDHGMQVRGYISCAVACPFEGRMSPDRVAALAAALLDLGADEVDLADTIGVAEPGDITLLINALTNRLGDDVLQVTTLHLHDTFGRAAEIVGEALQLGVRSFDGSVAGLGGCPFASRPGCPAPGNISTETLVARVHDAGYATGVNLSALAAAAAAARELVAQARAHAPASPAQAASPTPT